jgi:thioredoxin 1
MNSLTMITVDSIEHFQDLLQKEDAILFYFSHDNCNVCKVLKPKISEMIDSEFPKIKIAYSDTVKLPEIAGQNRIFAVPTILVFFGGKEYIRSSRNIHTSALTDQIRRPYDMMFS